MKVVIFGATGMVGAGVLLECLRDEAVSSVLTIGRSRTSREHPKLDEIVLEDFHDYEPIHEKLSGLDACFFCLGVSAVGMNETEYTRITQDLTLAAARALVAASPGITFCYVSGLGTDSSEQGRVMWAKVKGRTENALLRLPFRAFMFRPGFIQPAAGVQSRTRLYRVFYSITGPFYPVLRRLFPGSVTSSENLGRAMIRVAREGFPKRVLGNTEINDLAGL
jgi:uncharacterized protein YbjT (DUF2867 family)